MKPALARFIPLRRWDGFTGTPPARRAGAWQGVEKAAPGRRLPVPSPQPMDQEARDGALWGRRGALLVRGGFRACSSAG